MPKCKKCSDTGVIETGNNDLPCDCAAGDTALFNLCGIEGPVTGAEMRKHFLNGCPEPIRPEKKKIRACDLPGRATGPQSLDDVSDDGLGLLLRLGKKLRKKEPEEGE